MEKNLDFFKSQKRSYDLLIEKKYDEDISKKNLKKEKFIYSELKLKVIKLEEELKTLNSVNFENYHKNLCETNEPYKKQTSNIEIKYDDCVSEKSIILPILKNQVIKNEYEKNIAVLFGLIKNKIESTREKELYFSHYLSVFLKLIDCFDGCFSNLISKSLYVFENMTFYCNVCKKMVEFQHVIPKIIKCKHYICEFHEDSKDGCY